MRLVSEFLVAPPDHVADVSDSDITKSLLDWPRSTPDDFVIGQPAFIDLFQQIINGLPEQIALMDEDWNILVVNDAWSRAAHLYGYLELLPGTNYLRFCEAKTAEGHSPAAVVLAGISEIEAGGRNSFQFVYHGRDRWKGHAFQLNVNRLQILGRTFAMATRHEVTELLKLRQLRQSFSHSLIEGQADERRRMGREIHDSTLQLLAALSLAVGQLKRTHESSATVDIVSEIEQLLRETQKELRSISYLAHPPLVKEMGFADALRSLVDGYGRRTGLTIALNIDVGLNFAWRAAEVALYRVVQEALSNIHRHAHATEAAVTLTSRKTMLHVVVSDNGVGMQAQEPPGVGMPSMRQRLTELGGRLSVRRASPGMILIASVPSQSHIRIAGDLSIGA